MPSLSTKPTAAEKKKFVEDFLLIRECHGKFDFKEQKAKWLEYKEWLESPILDKLWFLESLSNNQKTVLSRCWEKFKVWIDSRSIITSVYIKSALQDFKETGKNKKLSAHKLSYTAKIGEFVTLERLELKSKQTSKEFKVFRMWNFEFYEKNEDTYCKKWVGGPKSDKFKWPTSEEPEIQKLGVDGIIHETGRFIAEFIKSHEHNLTETLHIDVSHWSRVFDLPKFRCIKNFTIRHWRPSPTHWWMSQIETIRTIKEVNILRNHDGSERNDDKWRDRFPFKNSEAMPYVMPFHERKLPFWVETLDEHPIFWAGKLTIEPTVEMRLKDISRMYSVSELNIHINVLRPKDLMDFFKMWSTGRMGHRMERLTIKLEEPLFSKDFNADVFGDVKFTEVNDMNVPQDIKRVIEGSKAFVIYYETTLSGPAHKLARTDSNVSTSESGISVTGSLGTIEEGRERTESTSSSADAIPVTTGRKPGGRLISQSSLDRTGEHPSTEREIDNLSTGSSRVCTSSSSESGRDIRIIPSIGGMCSIAQFIDVDEHYEIHWTAVRNVNMAEHLLKLQQMSRSIEDVGVSESPSNCTYCYTLECSLRIESTSSSKKKTPVSAKNAILTVGRNAQRQILLQIELKTTSSGQPAAVCYDANDAVIHLQNVASGKCTVEIPSRTIMLQLFNCAPRKLNVFMKSLQAKLDLMRTETNLSKKKSIPPQLSRLPAAFSVLSPLTIGEMRKVKQMREPLSVSSNGKQITTPKRRTSSTIAGGIENRIIARSIGLKRMQSFARDDKDKREAFAPLKPLKDCPSVVERIHLSEEQKNVVRTVINSRQSIFFTGSAGTGKSVILKRIIEMLPAKSTFVTAATGVAASQIGGITLHAFSGFHHETSSAELCCQQVMRQNHMVRQWKQCSHLIIDEISMVDSNFFMKLELVARTVRNSDLPFGGIQLVITGDFLQLPPVSKDEPKFCFESEAWSRCIQRTILLNTVKRQDDDVFVKILNSIRIGECDFTSADLLRKSSKNVFPPNVVPTRLCTHSEDAERINQRNLNSTLGDEKTFHAHDDDNFDSNIRTLAVKKLILKVGSQVMLTKNIDVNKGLCNGSRGYVEKFSETGNPVVRFVSQKDTPIEILRSKFSVRIPGSDVPLIRRQLPLQLAWAISIHKSQGLTLDCAEISLEKVFADGQAYVALSRARSLAAIRIIGFDSSCVRANPRVIDYYNSIGNDDEEDSCETESTRKIKKFKSI
ncbi:unnamed protein product [Caenorhabditis sp. 36 PRJEB53466]|nr:unnamed protein product [Caenorhabditis sp. 36 PRJEB53466]